MAPDILLLSPVMAARQRVARRDRCSRDQLVAFQQYRLLHHAAARSSYSARTLAHARAGDLQ